MKKIYELLNDAEMNLDKYENQKLSDYEILKTKKRILEEIRKMNKRRKKIKVSIAVACACVFVNIGSVSVAAAMGLLPVPDSLKKVFGIDSEKEMEVANDIGSGLDVSAENCGYKITAEGVLKDSKHISVVYKVEKADGSSLDEKNRVCTNVNFGECKYDASLSGGLYDIVENSNNSESLEFYESLTFREDINDTMKVSFKDMRLCFGKEIIDVDGSWELEIPLKDMDNSQNFAHGQKIEIGKNKGRIDELVFSSIGYSIRITSSEELSKNDIIRSVDGTHILVLKDGKRIELGGGTWVQDNGDKTWSFCLSGFYGEIIRIEDIDRVILGDCEIVC